MSLAPTTSTVSRQRYEIHAADDILTPALLIYRDLVAANIANTIRLLGGEANRWRPHVKTAKLRYVMEMLTARGVRTFKCSTSLELLTAIQAGASDVLVAYPMMAANATRVREISRENPQVSISVLIDDLRHIEGWLGSSIGAFIDINPGMNRTGIGQDRVAEIVELAALIRNAGLEFRGLHYYDGHLGSEPLPERTLRAHAGYDQLLKIVRAVQAKSISVKEVITAGTPSFPCTLSYSGFRHADFLHRASPGTVTYCDATATQQLPEEFGYVQAALVLSRVVSRPASGIITCDAGHKTLSVDCGVPNCIVAGMDHLQPLRPSEEHLPMRVTGDSPCPEVGDLLYLIPRHVCPTVNNFDRALIVADGNILAVERVDARGREGPLLQP